MSERDLGRIAAFTDGVMAVAITLLVLNLDVPSLAPGESLSEALVDELPSLWAYVFAFALVGRFWVIHHNLVERMRAFDDTLMSLNLVYLALIVLVPFSANLYDEYTSEPLAVAVLGGTLGLAASVNWLMTRHVLSRGFLHDEHVARTRSSARIGAFLSGIFLLSVPVAFLSVHLSQALWVLTIVGRYPLRRLGLTSSP